MAIVKLKGTVKQLAEQTGIAQPQLSNLLKMAKEAGVAKVAGYDGENYTGRGRIAVIYEVPETFKLPISLKKEEPQKEAEA